MPITTPIFRAFTSKHTALHNQLINDATVKYGDNELKIKALWDTGASGTCISTGVVQKFSLISTGKKNISSPTSTKLVDTYLIDIVLPNNVGIKDIEVCETEIGNQGFDLLVGMDIILLGDFAVSNYNGKTAFSFRIPSKQCADYVLQINVENKIGQKHGKGKRKKK